MKKILILITSLFLVGCQNGALKGELSNTCQKIEKTTNMEEIITYDLNFSAGKISKVTLTDKFISTNNSYLDYSLESYKRMYENQDGITVSINDNTITYIFDMSKVSSEIKNTFNLRDNYDDQIKLFKEKNVICK